MRVDPKKLANMEAPVGCHHNRGVVWDKELSRWAGGKEWVGRGMMAAGIRHTHVRKTATWRMHGLPRCGREDGTLGEQEEVGCNEPRKNDRRGSGLSVPKKLTEIEGCELLLRTLSVLLNDGTPDHGNVEKAVKGTGDIRGTPHAWHPDTPCCAQVNVAGPHTHCVFRVFCFSLLLLCMEEEVLEGTAAWIEIWEMESSGGQDEGTQTHLLGTQQDGGLLGQHKGRTGRRRDGLQKRRGVGVKSSQTIR